MKTVSELVPSICAFCQKSSVSPTGQYAEFVQATRISLPFRIWSFLQCGKVICICPPCSCMDRSLDNISSMRKNPVKTYDHDDEKTEDAYIR